jgi:hypothetical protein
MHCGRRRAFSEVEKMTPRRILVAGWALMLVYAYPGFMSYDSVLQLLQARDRVYVGGHPPMMGVLWGAVDALIPGPFGMLVIQVSCFLAGAYLLLARRMSERAAAITAVVVMLAPPVSAVLGVIWKDSQMLGFLTLGTALLLSSRRGVRVAGLGLVFAATAMRYNAPFVTLPLVVLLFEWRPRMRWYARYGIALAAWLGITLAANVANTRLADDHIDPWHDGIALFDITGTLRYAPELSDDELRQALEGTPLLVHDAIQATARGVQRPEDLDEHTLLTFGSGEYVPALWVTALHLFAPPQTDAQRAAIGRAWRTIVLGHLGAFATYRWHVTRERIHLGDRTTPSATYIWFTDVLDAESSARATEHNAVPSKLQAKLRTWMIAVGDSLLFRPWIYLAILVVMLAFAWRDRLTLALALSGLANEAALFLIAPTIDYRYSIWLVLSTLLVVAMLVASRAKAD